MILQILSKIYFQLWLMNNTSDTIWYGNDINIFLFQLYIN